MVYFAGKAGSTDEARALLKEQLSNGKALDKFADFIEAQGGSRDEVYNTENLPKASKSRILTADKDCYVSSIMSEDVGVASLLLGGGRRSKEDVIDLSVGIYLHKKVGEKCHKGEKIATLYGNDDKKIDEAYKRIIGAYDFSDTPVSGNTLIKGIVE